MATYYGSWEGPSYASYRCYVDVVKVSQSVSAGATFNVTAYFQGQGTDSQISDWGHTVYFSLGGVSGSIYKQVTIPDNGTDVMGTITITVPSSVGNNLDLLFNMPLRMTWASGTSAGSGSVIIDQYITACSAPTSLSLSISSGNRISLSWSGASSGANNSISSYYIEYKAGSGSWTNLTTVSSSSASGSYSYNTSLPVGTKLYYRIRTQGSAGGSYYSGFRESGTYVTVYATAVGVPPSRVLTFNKSTNKFTTTWGTSSGGQNNAVDGYYVEIQCSNDNDSWVLWNSYSAAVSTKSWLNNIVANGYRYFRSRIKASGSKGTSYDSAYGYTNTVQITDCLPPTEVSLSIDSSSKDLTALWSGASSGTNNDLNGYLIRFYRRVNSSASWSSFHEASISSSPYVLSNAVLNDCYEFFVEVYSKGSAGSSYYSDYKASSVITMSRLKTPDVNHNFNKVTGDISFSWQNCAAMNNVVNQYEYKYRINQSSWSESFYTTSMSYSTNIVKCSNFEFAVIARSKYGAIAYDSIGWGYSSVLYRPNNCTPPSSLSILKDNHTRLKFNWTQGSGGYVNSFIRSYSEYAYKNSESANWSSFTPISIEFNGQPPIYKEVEDLSDGAKFFKFRVRTEGEAGADFYSEYVESSVYEIERLNDVSNLQTIINENGSVSLSWVYSSASNNDLSEFVIELNENNSGIWKHLVNVEDNTFTTEVLPLEVDFVKFRIRAKSYFTNEVYWSNFVETDNLELFSKVGVMINGEIKQCPLFAVKDGEWKRMNIFVCDGSEWHKK